MKIYLEKIIKKEDLSLEEMKKVAQLCFTDNISDNQIAALLTGLRAKGETANEIAGMADVLRSESLLSTNEFPYVMDNCGTGGDGSNSFNISTTAAFVLAGANVTVAKHGNRSISSKTGSADVLEALDVPLNLSKEQIIERLQQNKIAFLFAPHVHPKMKRFTKIRKDLQFATIFNYIGPLTNPVNLNTQLVGVSQRNMLSTMAKSLHRLKRQRAIVVNGAGYMDEASLAGTNYLCILDNGRITSTTLHPNEVGLPMYSNDQIRGGDAKQNAAILYEVLEGKPGAYLDTVLLNAGLGLFANGVASSIQEGIERAKESIFSGKAMEKLENSRKS